MRKKIVNFVGKNNNQLLIKIAKFFSHIKMKKSKDSCGSDGITSAEVNKTDNSDSDRKEKWQQQNNVREPAQFVYFIYLLTDLSAIAKAHGNNLKYT